MTWNVRKSTPPDQTSTWDIMNPFIFHWTFTITTNETSTPLKIKMVHLNIMKSGKSSEPNLHDFGFKMWMLLILFNFQGRTPLFKIIPFSPCKFRMKQKNTCASETFSQTWRFEDKVPQRRWSSWAKKKTKFSRLPGPLKLTDSSHLSGLKNVPSWETHLSLTSVFQVRTGSFREGN